MTTAAVVTPERLITVSSDETCDAASRIVFVSVWKPERTKVIVYSPGGMFAKT